VGSNAVLVDVLGGLPEVSLVGMADIAREGDQIKGLRTLVVDTGSASN
jgi:hypothetical protein